MEIEILNVQGLDVTARFTFADGSSFERKISMQPYGKDEMVDDGEGGQKSVIIMINPADDIFKHLKEYGENHKQAENALIANPAPTIDAEALIGQTQSFPE